MHISTIVFDLSLASLLGGMLFFPAVVAPLVFRTLETDDAGRFLRALFPRYYVYMIVTAVIAALAAIPVSVGAAATLGAVAVTTLLVRQLLVPRLNAWRDAELTGDAEAGRRFATGHRLSVFINLLQLVAVIVIVVRSA